MEETHMATAEINAKNTDVEIPKETIEDSSSLPQVMSRNVYTDPTPAITGETLLSTQTSSGNTFTCTVCKISITGLIPYNNHLQGNSHKCCLTQLHFKEKLEGEQKKLSQRLGPNRETPLALNGIESNIKTYTKVCPSSDMKFCTDDEAEVQETLVVGDMETKMSGILKDPDEPGNVCMTQKTSFSCTTCKKSYPTLKVLKEHLFGNAHKKTARFLNLYSEVHSATSEIKNQMAPPGKNADCGYRFLRCKFCHCNFNGPIPFQQHLISEAHKTKVKKAEQESQMKSVLQQEEDNETLYRKEHRESLCVSSSELVKSSSYLKFKIKQDQMLTLLNEFPELRRKAVGSGLLEQLSVGPDTVLECLICHSYFNGPQPALEHCRSKKHIKVKNALKQLQVQSPEQRQ